MLIAHEQQHNETMLQLLQMVDGYEPHLEGDAAPTSEPHLQSDAGPAAAPAPTAPEMVAIEGGGYEIGAPATGFAYDNERPRHGVELAAFEIDRTPVTNGAYIAYIEETGAEPPLYWERDGNGGWLSTAMGRRAPIDLDSPVVHVSWHEADAFARRAGKRLPSEHEWEVAASAADRSATASGAGLERTGQVWEWTSSDFLAYPGFEPFPYREYSEPFFGGTYKVLRGGSWATDRNLIRPSFRNWDLPRRRQIFSGFRCARDGG